MSKWMHWAHQAHREGEHGSEALAGVLWLVGGFFLAPVLIGLPMMGYGVYKLCKS